MKRRSLFKSFVAIIAASAVEVMGWKNLVPSAPKVMKMAIVNPAYINAAYEDTVIFNEDVSKEMRDYYSHPRPRFNEKMERVPPFILVDSPIQDHWDNV